VAVQAVVLVRQGKTGVVRAVAVGPVVACVPLMICPG
jgi:hypothetical protein